MPLLGPLLAVCLALQATARQTAGGAPEGLGADRPGIGVGADIVPPGVFQIEAGTSLAGGREGPTATRVFAAGNPLFRLGLFRRVEMRFDGDAFRRESSRTAGGLSAGAANPSFVVAWSRSLPRSLTAGGNFAFASIKDGEGRFLRQAHSLVFGFPAVRRLGGFSEVYRVSSAERGASPNWAFDAGFVLPLGGRAQLDVESGHTLHSAASSWFCGMGIVFRVPKRLGK